MEAKKFKNFSGEDFTWKHNGIPFSFKAGQETYLEADKAEHFAKHLVDRELMKLNLRTDNPLKRAELLANCFPGDEIITQTEAFDLEEKKKELERTSKKEMKRGRPRKEEEFPDLNQ